MYHIRNIKSLELCFYGSSNQDECKVWLRWYGLKTCCTTHRIRVRWMSAQVRYRGKNGSGCLQREHFLLALVNFYWRRGEFLKWIYLTISHHAIPKPHKRHFEFKWLNGILAAAGLTKNSINWMHSSAFNYQFSAAVPSKGIQAKGDRVTSLANDSLWWWNHNEIVVFTTSPGATAFMFLYTLPPRVGGKIGERGANTNIIRKLQ